MEDSYKPKRLYAFLPKECLKKGVTPGGWAEPVVPAFDPEQKSVDSMRESFNEHGDRILMEYLCRDKFVPRPTGPDNKPQGIYISHEPIPSWDLFPLERFLDEDEKASLFSDYKPEAKS